MKPNAAKFYVKVKVSDGEATTDGAGVGHRRLHHGAAEVERRDGGCSESRRPERQVHDHHPSFRMAKHKSSCKGGNFF